MIEKGIEEQLEGNVDVSDDLIVTEIPKSLELFRKYANIFIQNSKKPLETRLTSYVIEIGTAQPVLDTMHRFPPELAEEIEKQVQEVFANGSYRISPENK